MTEFQKIQPATAVDIPTRQISGYAAALITVVIWSSYFLSLRLGVMSPLSSVDLSLIRYTLPGTLLLPVFFKSLVHYRKTPLWAVGAIIFGSGLAFFLLSMLGMRRTNVMFGATLIPGTIPIFVTLLAFFLFKQPMTKKRTWGLSLIALGVALLLGVASANIGPSAVLGAFLLLSASLLWSLFTLAVRLSGLRPIQVAALVSVPNGVVVFLWALVDHGFTSMSLLTPKALISQMLVQGLLVGIFSGWFYSFAIRRIGAEQTSTIGAATPLLASLLAAIFLHESLELLPLLGVCLTAVGVVVANQKP